MLALLACASCSDSDESFKKADGRVAILTVGGDSIYLDDIKSKPPTDEQIRNLVTTDFHQELSYLVSEKVLAKAQAHWNVAFTDQDVALVYKDHFDQLTIDRKAARVGIKRIKARIASLRMLLNGDDPEIAYAGVSEDMPFDQWKRFIGSMDKPHLEKLMHSDKAYLAYSEQLLKMSDKQIKEKLIKDNVQLIRPLFRNVQVAKEICLEGGIEPMLSEHGKRVSDECARFAADRLVRYMREIVKVKNPVAGDYEFHANYYQAIKRLGEIRN